MKPFNYVEQIIRMKNKSDKFDLRLRSVKAALAYGVKPAARLFDTTPKTIRKWRTRYKQERLASLNELPRIPLHCPLYPIFYFSGLLCLFWYNTAQIGIRGNQSKAIKAEAYC